MRSVFVGGPLHGHVKQVDADQPPWTVLAPRHIPWSLADVLDDGPPSLPDPWQYELRRAQVGDELIAVYLCHEDIRDRTETYPPPSTGTTATEPWSRHLADRIWYQEHERYLPGCVAPGCAEKARMTWTVAEPWARFAGRYWDRDDQIHLCPQHDLDVRRSTGVYGADKLPEWLRADLMYDPLDLAGVGYLDQRELNIMARIARLAQPA